MKVGLALSLLAASPPQVHAQNVEAILEGLIKPYGLVAGIAEIVRRAVRGKLWPDRAFHDEGVHEVLDGSCYLSGAAPEPPSGVRTSPLCGIKAVNPRRLSSTWSEAHGYVYDGLGGPNSQCGTLISSTADNTPPGLHTLFPGLWWLNDNWATTALGEQVVTWAHATPIVPNVSFANLNREPIEMYVPNAPAEPSFAVRSATLPDDRWSYDDRCISSNGIMHSETPLETNFFEWYCFVPSTAVGSAFVCQIGYANVVADWTQAQTWYISGTVGGTSARRHILDVGSLQDNDYSYSPLQITASDGSETEHFERFVSWFEETSGATSLLLWQDNCLASRMCGLDQINLNRNGCARTEKAQHEEQPLAALSRLLWPLFVSRTDTEEEAALQAEECCTAAALTCAAPSPPPWSHPS